MHFHPADGDFLDLAGTHVVHELGEGQVLVRTSLAGADDGHEDHHQQDQDHPENRCFQIGIHTSLSPCAPTTASTIETPDGRDPISKFVDVTKFAYPQDATGLSRDGVLRRWTEPRGPDD